MTLYPNLEVLVNKVQGRERRYKGVLIDPRHVVFVAMGPRDCEYINLMYEDLPQDAEVIEVTYDWSRQSFVMSLWHESFDIVPDGQQIPIHFPIGIKVVRHLCCQPTRMDHKYLPNSHNDLFNEFIRDRRSDIKETSTSEERETRELAELDSWIKEYQKEYGVWHEC